MSRIWGQFSDQVKRVEIDGGQNNTGVKMKVWVNRLRATNTMGERKLRISHNFLTSPHKWQEEECKQE